ncbi:18169_t:CDS:2, partial [Racocetra fulgida]
MSSEKESPPTSTENTHISAQSEIGMGRQSPLPINEGPSKNNQQDINKLTEEMFFKVADYLKGEILDTSFEPYIQQIDEICEQVDFLEKVANELDEYSKEL